MPDKMPWEQDYPSKEKMPWEEDYSAAPMKPQPQQQRTPPKQKQDYLTFLEDAINSGSKSVAQFGKGALQGVGETLNNVTKLVNPTQFEVPDYDPKPSLKEGYAKGEIAPVVGYTASKVAEQLLPGKLTGKAAEYLQNSSALKKALGVAATEGAGTAAMTGIQTGDPEAATAAGLMAGGTSLVFAPVMKWAADKVGKSIQMSTVRPRQVDMEDGFTYENMKKLGLRGDLKQSYEQVEGKLAELRNARNAQINPANAQPVRMADIFDSVEKQLEAEAKAGKHIGDTEAMRKWLQHYRDEYATLGMGNTAGIDVAENMKEKFYKDGLWMYGRTAPDEKAREYIANRLGLETKAGIEKALPSTATVKELNREMQKLIPIRNAMLARIPVDERNRLFSLSDVTALSAVLQSSSPSALALPVAVRLMKNNRFGNWLARNGESASRLPASTVKALSGMYAGLGQEEE